MKKRFLSMVLALVLIFSMIPITSMTASAATSGSVDGFSYNFRYGYCKHCKDNHAVETVEFKSVKVDNGNVTLTFLISFSNCGTCSKTVTPKKYDSSNTSTGFGFTYEITQPFSCTKSFSYSKGKNAPLDCGESKPRISFNITRNAGHNVSIWTSAGTGKHSGYCSLCKQTITENCSGGTATCKDKAVCSKCNTAYGSTNNNHSWSEWTANNGKHTRTCLLDSSHTETANCSGGTATCTSKAVCSTCKKEYGSFNNSNHNWGNWTSNGNGTHTRKCTLNEAHTETENCSGGTASCTDKAICSVCKTEYGSVSGHSYQYSVNGNVITETCKNNCTHKETATLKADNSVSLVYDGSARKPLTVEYSDGWSGDKTAEITYADDCIGVGKHTGSVTIGGVTATQDFNISQAQNSWNTEPSISGWTYGQTASTPNKGTPKFGSVTKVEYKSADANDTEYSTTVPTNAGSYKVRFTVEGNVNYTSLTKEINFEIEKAKLTVKADDKSKTYGETDPTLTWKITGGKLVGNDTLSSISVIRENGEDAKTYTINAGQTAGANPNYDITFETGTFTVNKKTIGISWGNKAFTYDGGTKLPTATATGMVFNDEIGLDKIYYYLAIESLTEEQVKALSSDKWTEYTGEFNINPQDEYIIYAKASDKDGNTRYVSSEKGIVVDSIAPVISGIANGETHYGDTTFTVTDKHIDEVKVDGNKVILTADGKYTIIADGKEHTIVATDKSGNASAEIKITVITIASLDDTIESITIDNVKSSDKQDIQDVLDFVNGLINSGKDFTEAEETQLADIKANTENLIDKIDDTAKEIKDITDSVNAYETDKVKSDDKQDIEDLIDCIDSLNNTENVTESEKTALEEVKSTANDLITKIEDTASDVKDLTDTVNGYDKDKVTSDDKKNIEDLIDEIDKLLDGDNLNDSEKEELNKVKDTANGLVDKINEAADSSKTENTDKVKDTTADNVKTEDKKDLEKAKDDLEKTLEDYKDNLTDDEKKEIEKEIERIEKALEVIDKVENVEDLINKLPDTITKGDADAIKKADESYNALSKYEQSILDTNAKKKLDNAKSALEALNKATTSPATGDNSHIWLWFALLFVSGGGILGTTVCRRKKKYSAK